MELHLDKVSLGYDELIIKKQELKIEPGTWNFIVGETGSGKSTLLQGMAGLLPLKEGEISWQGANLKDKKNLKRFREETGIMFQYTEKQFFNNSIKEEIIFSLKNKKTPNDEIEKALLETISLLDIPEEILGRHPHEISGGQKRFVALASILIEKPTLLFLDEPTSGLDIKSQALFFKVLKKLRDSGVTIIQVSHILEDVLTYGDNSIVMDMGEIKRIGAPKEVLKDMETETAEIFRNLKELGLDTDFDTIDSLLRYIGGDNYVK